MLMDKTSNENKFTNSNKNYISTNQKNRTTIWGSWEELILASAVKRHGFNNWDSVSMEVQSKTSLSLSLSSPISCNQKFVELNRRFTGKTNTAADGDDIPWFEDLRRLRIEELKSQVKRSDLTISSLESKVKGLEESERGESSKEGEPDLEEEYDNPKRDGSENDKTEPAGSEPKKSAVRKTVTGEESDRDNRSVNESNSTREDGKPKTETVREPSLVKKPAGDDSCNVKSEVSRSAELGDSRSGGIQSSASLGKKKSKKNEMTKTSSIKSEPFDDLLEMIRAHPDGSLFERRLPSQETEGYKKLVRQHMDLQTIQGKVVKGLYSSSSIYLYRDLLLLFNNVIIYYDKSSSIWQTAYKLRSLVSQEVKKHYNSSRPTKTLAPLLKPKVESESKQKAKPSLVVCRKRSSVSTKATSTSSISQKGEKKKQRTEEGLKKDVDEEETDEEKPITGMRSSRRSSSSKNPNPIPNSKKQNSKQESSKAKKNETLSSSDKKRSVVDFLKRIKKNADSSSSPKKSNNNKGEVEEKKKGASSSNGNVKEKGKERVLRSKGKEDNSNISPSKKKSKSGKKETVTSGKRGREGGGGDKNKPEKKKVKR